MFTFSDWLKNVITFTHSFSSLISTHTRSHMFNSKCNSIKREKKEEKKENFSQQTLLHDIERMRYFKMYCRRERFSMSVFQAHTFSCHFHKTEKMNRVVCSWDMIFRKHSILIMHRCWRWELLKRFFFSPLS